VLKYIVFAVSAIILMRAELRGQSAQDALTLQESKIVKSAFRAVPPFHCDLSGKLYARVLELGGNSAIVRFDDEGEPEVKYSFAGAPDSGSATYTIVDYAPTTGGEIFVIAIRATLDRKGSREVKRVLARLGDDGRFDRLLPISEMLPERVAVFADGNLLLSGLRPTRSGAASTDWITGIFQPNGVLIKNIDLEPAKLNPHAAWSAGTVAHPQPNSAHLTSEQNLAVQQLGTISRTIGFFPSTDGNIYSVLLSSTDLPSLGDRVSLAQISRTGEVRRLPAPLPAGEGLFALVVSGRSFFALFATPAGGFGDLQRLDMNSANELQVTGRYRTLGFPCCTDGNHLTVVRPDGHYGTFLVTYTVP